MSLICRRRGVALAVGRGARLGIARRQDRGPTMAGRAAISGSAAAMARYEPRLRTMTRAVLLADDRRSALAMVAGRACQAVQAAVGAVLVQDSDGIDIVLTHSNRCPELSRPLAERLLSRAHRRPTLMDVSSEGIGEAIAARAVSSKCVRGVLMVARTARARPFTDSDTRLLEPFVAETALALAVAAARRDLEQGLLRKDRMRIARELHDGVIQSLYGIGLVIEGIRNEAVRPRVKDQLFDITQTVNLVIDDLRAYINDLTPSRLARRGLGSELRSLTTGFQASTGVVATIRLDDGLDEIGATLGRDLVQIAREALANVAKHAGASRVDVRAECGARTIKLDITDDGRGITPKPAGRGRGLENIVLRAQAWGGTAEIGRYGGIGTTVRVTIPIGEGDAARSGERGARRSGDLAVAG